MAEWQAAADESGEFKRPDRDTGWRVLLRLRWGLRIATLLGVGSWGLYNSLVNQLSWRDIAPDLAWGALLGFALIQICFRVVLRLYGQMVAERQRLLQLQALSQRLLTSLHAAPARRRSDTASLEIQTQILSLNHGELSSALEGLVAICGAQRASLLLLGAGDRSQVFLHVGLSPGVEPGPAPVSLTLEDLTPADLESDPWIAYVMPEVERVGAFVAAPVVTAERRWGYLALADDAPFSPHDRSLVSSFAGHLGVVLENAGSLAATQRRLAEAAALTQVTQAISSRLTEEEILPYLAESLARLLDSTGCVVVLGQAYGGELRMAASFGDTTEGGRSFAVADGYAGLVRALMEEEEPILVGDIADSDYVPARVAEGLAEKSLLGLPFMVQGQAIGAVIVSESRQPRCYTESEVGRATIVVNQGAVAVANARLFREAERRLVELGTLAEISRVIFSSLTVSDIYQRVVNELARAFGYPFVAFYQVEGDGLELGAQVGYGAGHPPARIPWGQGLIGDAAATGQTGYVPDAQLLADQETAADGVTSQIALPLRKEGRVLGVLSVESHAPLTEADLSLLQSLSYQVSTALENARLYAAEQREQEVARTLLQITSDLGGTLHLDEVLNLILERLQVVVPYESAAIGLLAGDVCYVAAAQGLPQDEELWAIRLSPHDLPLVARVLLERTAVIVPDTSQAEDWVAIAGGEGVRSWLGVPLVVQDRPIGLLMLNHMTPGFYDENGSQLALAFAQHAALALDNARLYEQAQAALREQTLLHEMTTVVASTLDAGRVLRLLSERLVAVLGVTSTRIATLGDEMETANLVAEYFSAEADAAERVSSVGESYELAAFPVTTEKLMKRERLLVALGSEPREWRRQMLQRAGRAMLLIPLVARDRVTGFVELWDSRSRRVFTEAEIALAQTLINPAAVAIDNARLFAETQRSISEMMLLYDIAVAAASTLELDTVLQSVVKTLQFRVLEGSVVNIWLIDSTEGVLQLRAHAGELEGMTQMGSLRLDEGLCGQVVQTGQPILIDDVRQEPTRANHGPDVRSILCVPLAWGQRVVGVLQALSAHEGAFSSNDLRLLRTMAGSLAIAIENVRLFAQVKHSEEALTLRNQALEQANDRLQELDRLKSAFIASVSHELRTPLNSIIGFSEVLVDGLAGDLEPVAQEFLGYIHDSGTHLLALINDILDLSRIQAGRLTLKLDDVDLMAVVEEVRTTLAPMTAKKRQTFTLEQEQGLPVIVADRFRLKQILLNLAGNACKFTQEEGQITVRVHMVDPETLRLDVVDNGPGIPLSDRKVIFEEFKQARTTQPGEGTGLGLAITRRLVELHGGRIWLESKPDSGATFTVLFPVAGPEAGPDGAREEEKEKVG